ncbi:circadian clock protein KaiC [Variovorax ginsengisoli]|uniref:non-specific serine/threonine protein kinase n=1 Tax=Variovorax ginsengisoli TaxID=363844 RepID=A0ABT9SDP7_9BURK|nr:circadian clock protein KaiC [Variovorax ginsengisoli]MDP9902483.1 circadian clock protein KaiC [Variovorax ginsengisoli]
MTERTSTPRMEKIRTGIPGFDRMTFGGLPQGRVSAVIGAAGAGKTVFAMQTLVNIVRTTGGVGVFVSFEQTIQGVISDLSSFDWDAMQLVDGGRLLVVDGRPQADVLHSGAFDLIGLLAMVEGAASPGAPVCVVFDGIDALLSLLGSPTAQRAELLRLQEHVSKLNATMLLTVKAMTAMGQGFEEIALYMADCVVELTRDAQGDMSSRSMRIQKYRSSSHAQSKVPFVMTAQGIEVESMDVEAWTSPVSTERLSVGIEQLDAMLRGGIFRGSSTLLSGAPGTAKTTLGTRFIDAACRRAERALCICFDESPQEIVRNVASVGTLLAPHIASGLLQMHGPADHAVGADELVHEIMVHIRRHQPRHLMVDPVSVFTNSTNSRSAVQRLVKFCKREGITVVMTSLLERSAGETESSRSYVSSLCDNWIHLSYLVQGGERNRALTVVKSRGTAHSNQVGELLLGDDGVTLADVYVEDGAVLMGSLRWQKERANQQALQETRNAADDAYREAEHSVEDLSRRLAYLQGELLGKQQELVRLRSRAASAEAQETSRREQMTELRRPASLPPLDTFGVM